MRDTGIGIPREAQEHVFERFYRADEARNRDSGGAGLGLAIAEQLVEDHEGRIALESFPGEGSTFTRAALPLAHGARPGQPTFWPYGGRNSGTLRVT